MNHVNREDVIRAARKAINERFDTELMTKLQNRAEEYGKQQHLVDDVDHWLQKLKKTPIENWSKPTRDKWLENDWLPSLPYPLKP